MFLECRLGAVIEVVDKVVHHPVEKLNHKEGRNLTGGNGNEEEARSVNGDQVVVRRGDDRADVGIVVALPLCVQEVITYGAIDDALPVLLDEDVTRCG